MWHTPCTPVLGLRMTECGWHTLPGLCKVYRPLCWASRALLHVTLWQKCWVVMLKTSVHSEAVFNCACRVCSCRACRSHRSRSCWIRARSSSRVLSVRTAPWAPAVRPWTADTHNRRISTDAFLLSTSEDGHVCEIKLPPLLPSF